MGIRLEFCALDAVEDVMAFLRDHWSSEHVLARSRALMDWQHRDTAHERYNFLVARDATNVIVGILGFIPASRYDASLDRETIWLTTWKVIDGASAALGLLLLRELTKRLKPAWIGTAGANPATLGIYAALGYRTGVLDRYYRLNTDLDAFRLAVVPAGGRRPQSDPTGDMPLLRVVDAELDAALRGIDFADSAAAPGKTPTLFRERYLAHPYYEYQLYLARNGRSAAVLVMRMCTHNGAHALRIVDMLGDGAVLAECGRAFDALLRTTNSEYIDFYLSPSAGVFLSTAGFEKLGRDDDVVLPSYFEPFDQRNVDVHYAIKGPGERLVICKGDADQDRPNLLPNS